MEKKTELEHWENGMPKLKLKNLKGKLVHAPNQRTFDRLMQIYECGGWKNWSYIEEGRRLPTDNPSKVFFASYVNASDEFSVLNHLNYGKNEDRLSLAKFCYLEKITPAHREEINDWFNEYKPDRESRNSHSRI